VEFVLVGEMPFKIAASGECSWTERAVVLLRQSTEKLVEVKVSEHGGGELTIFAVEKGKVAVVHPDAMECSSKTWIWCEERGGLFNLLSSRGIGHMLVNEVHLEVVLVFE
jgi:hypothetical protein